MSRKPITPGQKAAKARDRERFAAKLAGNEAAADRAHNRLQNGDRLTRRPNQHHAFPDGEAVTPAILAILEHRKVARVDGDQVIANPPDA